MSASTLERPAAGMPDAEELARRREYDAAVARRVKEVAGEQVQQQKGMFRRALEWIGNKAKQAWQWFTGKVKLGAKWIAETTRKIWGSTKRTVKRVWDWSTDKAKRAWSWMKDKAKKTWNWTKVNAKKAWGWTKVNAKKAWNWTKINSKKAWSWTKVNGRKLWSWAKRTWIGASIAARAASFAGVGIFGGLIGAPLLMIAGLGTAAFLLINSSTPAKKSADEKADDAYANELMSKDVLLINTDQERALINLYAVKGDEHQAKLNGQISEHDHSYYVGYLEFLRVRVQEKSTASRVAIYDEYKAAMDSEFEGFLPESVKAGMMDAERDVKKLLREHKVQTTPVLA